MTFVTSYSLSNNKLHYKFVTFKSRNTKLSSSLIKMSSQQYNNMNSINSNDSNIVKITLSNVKNIVGSSAKVLVSSSAMVLIFKFNKINQYYILLYIVINTI